MVTQFTTTKCHLIILGTIELIRPYNFVINVFYFFLPFKILSTSIRLQIKQYFTGFI